MLDDVPSAEDVGAELGEGVYDAITGNVMTDGETPDAEGADTARVTEVVVGDDAPVAVPASGTVEVAGEYGVLTIAADGSYSYVRNAGTPGGVSDVFTYTLTDADGDSDTATLTIAIADAGVSIDDLIPEGAEASLVVNEAHLAVGSDPTPDALTQTGSFTISAPDGVKSLSVGGESIVQDGAVADTLPTITTDAGNVLAITGYTDNGDGTYTVSYSYTLNGAKDHSDPAEDASLDQQFLVELEDMDGDTATGNLVVTVLDDIPVSDVRNVIFQNGGDFSFVGTAVQMGADQEGAEVIWTQAPEGLFYQGALLQYDGVGTNTLVAYVGEGDERIDVFKLVGNSDGSYVYEQFQPIDLVTTEIRDFTAGDFNEAGGPEPNIYILEDGSITRTEPGAGSPWAVEISGIGGSGGNADQINSNANGFGVGNPSFDKGESITFDFDLAAESGGVDLFSSASIKFSATSGIVMDYVVTYSDGSKAIGTFTQGDLINQAMSFDAPSGLFLDSIELYNQGSGTQITGFGVSQIVELIDEGLPFDIGFEAIDGDGDMQGGVIDFFAEPGQTLDASGTLDGVILVGSEADNELIGGAGDDILTGGAGDDILYGGLGDDVFKWNFGDQGEEDAAATDVVKDFGTGENVLDIADLLQGMDEGADLASYLHATEEGGNTLLHISTGGNLAVDGSGVSGADQVIVLEGIGYSADIIQQLMADGQLQID
ncbi:hypothetical protein CR158_18585 [Halomonas heilongjiangensis]|uniref:Type I secretion C-terminal target domain-containing protein n=1 Tax=Halomonas heilongjiangensis TaxID=1387883 RepID=A0A2N7TQS7_9GAMM|nr:hypothetical protein C1H66_06515 [Halomonas heilongjiangensis]PXX87465.1 hypothetical protein CR158_18585 [Halomonas heilongjiangensis]